MQSRDPFACEYRQEESFKVLVHELMHALGLDFSSMDCDVANNIIINNFKGIERDCDYRIYESYCETWAQIINILIIVSRENVKDYMKKINEYLFYEKLWSIFQCAKVLHHYDISYINILEGNDHYTETKTQVFSYYILRAIAMTNLNEFVCWCCKNNSNIIVFKKNQENIKSFDSSI